MNKSVTPLALAAALLVPGVAEAAPKDARQAPAARMAGHLSVGAQSGRARVDVLRQRLVRTNIRLSREVARLEGERVTRRDRTRAKELSIGVLQKRNAKLRHRLERLERRAARRAAAQDAVAPAAAAATTAPAQPTAPATGSTASGGLEAIAACESGGDPSAVGGGGLYRGKYQFDQQTWQSVGGSGDPAAASEAEQDQRAAQLYAQRGSSPWPVCG